MRFSPLPIIWVFPMMISTFGGSGWLAVAARSRAVAGALGSVEKEARIVERSRGGVVERMSFVVG